MFNNKEISPENTAFALKEDTLSYKYIKLIKQWLPGIWPKQAFGVREPFWKQCYTMFIPFQSAVILLGQLLFLYEYSSILDFFQLSYCYLLIVFAVQAMARETIPNLTKYGDVVKKILVDFHIGHIKHNGQFNKQIFDTVQRVSNMFTLYLIIMVYIGMLLFSLAPLYLNYKMGFFNGKQPENSTCDCIICFIFPGFIDTSQFSISSTAYTIYITYPCSISVCGVDIILSLMAFQIIGNILILRNDLETLPRPKNCTLISMQRFTVGGTKMIGRVDCGFFDAEENKHVHGKLVECLKHHRMIVSFTGDVSEFFGPFLGLNYALHITSCCLLLLLCSQGGTDGIIRFGPLTIIIFGQLIMMSVIFEIVATVSEKLKDSMYGTPWECMDTKNRRTVHIMLIRMQKPIVVTAMGMTKVGVTTMAQILKATFSYYTLLRSANE